MTWRDAVLLAASGLRGSIVRTILTILGLGVGVGAVLTVMTLGSAGQARVEDEIARLGIDMVWIRPQDPDARLTADCAPCVADATGAPACASVYTAGLVSLNGEQTAAQIAGYDGSFAEVYQLKAGSGRLFTAQEQQRRSAVCVVDRTLANALGGRVLDQYINAGARHFRVIGVIDGLPMQTMSGGSGIVLLPLGTYADTFGGSVQEVTIAVPRGESAARLARQALNALEDQGAYRADTLENEIEAAREVVRIFVMVLACVAVVCMITGAIGVMNVLLVSVRERKREIGLIKAVGGTSGQVALLFVLEAAAYAVLGGILGIVLGIGMIRACGWWIGLTAQLSAWTALPVLLGAALLGMGFGVVPALRAASMQPVDALRSE